MNHNLKLLLEFKILYHNISINEGFSPKTEALKIFLRLLTNIFSNKRALWI